MRLLRLLLVLLSLPPLAAAAEDGRTHYLMGCVGCHGENGVTISRRVPDLKGQVGFFLNLPEGREYLARLPNVAFAPISDQGVADMLNYMVFTLGEGSAPKGAKPYNAAEVGRLRKQPLTEVPLFQYRGEIVERLIATYQAPESLRFYGQGLY
jgi:mono/diheme cytochrome c family protein